MSHHPISPEIRLEICRALGEYKRPIEIRDELKKRGVLIQLTSINYYEKKAEWKTVIDKYRREYQASLMKIPIAQKVWRIRKLDDLVYGLEHNDGRFKFSSDRERYDRIVAALEQTSKELEPSKHDTYNISMVNQYNSLTDEEVKERKTILMEKILKIHKMMEETKDASSIGEAKEIHGSRIGKEEERVEDKDRDEGKPVEGLRKEGKPNEEV